MAITRRPISRKDFLRFGALTGATAVLAACGGAPATTPAPAAEPTKPAAAATSAPAATKPAAASTTAPAAAAPKSTLPESDGAPAPKTSMLSTTMPTKFSESPMLADLVKAGKLPPVEKRLPEEPLVVKPPEEIGQYGGTFRNGDFGTKVYGGDMYRIADGTQEMWIRIQPDLKNWEPNLAKDMKVSADKTTYTLTLRKGIKWSDGEPVTVKDYMFWYEDILQDKSLQPSIPVYYSPDGKLMEMTTPDDYTCVIKFAVPQPFFAMSVLAHRQGYKNAALHPFHYLKQFHPKYNPKAADDAKANKYDTWFACFGDKADFEINKDLPNLTPYKPVEVSSTGVKFERNPYFWQVDTAGNQLPYVDKCEMERVTNAEMFNAKIVTGSYDVAGKEASIINYAAYEKGAAQGNYRIVFLTTGKGSECFYQVNMTTADPVLRKIHQDVRYRQALSLAINRDEINNLLYFGKATPRQMTVLPDCTYYKPEYEKSFAQFDVKKANALLDEMGLKMGPDGIRLRSDGKPMKLNFDLVETETPKVPITELVVDYWKKIGIDVAFKSVTRQLLGPRVLANEEPMFLWHGDAVTDILLPTDRKWSIGKYGDDCGVAPLWTQWYDTKGKQGEEPPAGPWKDAYEAYLDFQKTGNAASADKLLKAQSDNLWSIGTVGLAPHPLMVRTNLRNVIKGTPFTWDNLWTWPYHTATWFFKK